MNIFNFNNKLYGIKKLKQGEYVDFKIESINQQELLKIYSDSNNNIYNNFIKTNREIKF